MEGSPALLDWPPVGRIVCGPLPTEARSQPAYPQVTLHLTNALSDSATGTAPSGPARSIARAFTLLASAKNLSQRLRKTTCHRYRQSLLDQPAISQMLERASQAAIGRAQAGALPDHRPLFTRSPLFPDDLSLVSLRSRPGSAYPRASHGMSAAPCVAMRSVISVVACRRHCQNPTARLLAARSCAIGRTPTV